MNEEKRLKTTQALAKKCKQCVLENCMKCPFEEFNLLFGPQIERFNKRKVKTFSPLSCGVMMA